MSSLLRLSARSYNNLVNRHPVLAQSIMASSTCMIGDFFAQTTTPYLIYCYHKFKNPYKNIEYSNKEYDFVRTLKFGLIGLLYLGPIDSRWLRYIDRKLASKKIKYAVPKKVVADQFVFDPVLTFGYVFLITYLSKPLYQNFDWKSNNENSENTENITVSSSINLASKEILPIMLTSWPFWCVVQSFNFAFVPLNFRLLVIQCGNIVWNSFLSWYASTAALREDEKKRNN